MDQYHCLKDHFVFELQSPKHIGVKHDTKAPPTGGLKLNPYNIT